MNDSLGRKLIFERWEFWVGLLVLVVGVFFLKNYFEWVGNQAVVRMQGMLAQEEWQRMQLESGALEAAYRADAYGGATPEETLRLFVEALEKEDYVLASKYFVVEKQNEILKQLQTSDVLNDYLKILASSKKGFPYQNKKQYEILFYDSNGKQIHIEQFVLNEFTGKWKILE